MAFANTDQLEEALERCPFQEGATHILLWKDHGNVVWWRDRLGKFSYSGPSGEWHDSSNIPYHKADALKVPNEFLIDRWLENDNVRK